MRRALSSQGMQMPLLVRCSEERTQRPFFLGKVAEPPKASPMIACATFVQKYSGANSHSSICVLLDLKAKSFFILLSRKQNISLTIP